MRLARALRPLRLMKRNAGMKMLIDALIGTLYPVALLGAGGRDHDRGYGLWTSGMVE